VFFVKEYDILLIHPPRLFEKDFLKLGERACYMSIPMGLFGMADLLDKEGFSTRILNIPLEMLLNKDWSLEGFLKNVKTRIYAISLHWVLNSYGAIEVANKCKEIDPTAKVILGGFTSSYFDLEIMRNFPFVDGIIRGEGELPILKLTETMYGNKPLNSIPNFTFRRNGRIVRTPLTYVAKSIDHMSFANVELLHHWREYLRIARETMGLPFSIMVGRGCPFDCPFCGGGQTASKIISGRKSILLRSVGKVVEDIQKIIQTAKVESIYFGHGVYPQNTTYWKKLFSLIRKEKIDIGADLEIWRLPLDKAFINDFHRTFATDNSSLSFVVYPKRIRRLLAPLADSLINYEETDIRFLVENAVAHDISLRLWFTVGNPFETAKDILEDLSFMAKLFLDRGAYNHITLYNTPVTIGPGSPAFQNPDKFGIRLWLTSFMDFYRAFGEKKFTFGEFDGVINYRTPFLSGRNINLWNKIFNFIEVPFHLVSSH